MPVACKHLSEVLPSAIRPALMVGHPGHELKVLGWVAQYKPRVHVVTDGSGRHGISRLPSTAALLTRLGCEPGEVFGVATDARIYEAILTQDTGFFVDVLNSLAASLVKQQANFVAGDAREGFNPTHDLCRALLNAAVKLAERAMGTTILNCEFCLTEASPEYREVHDEQCFHLHLEDDQLRQKLEAAEAYQEMQMEVRQALKQCGHEYFRIECFRKSPGLMAQMEEHLPFYEKWGEQRVAEGEYRSVIRFQEHVLPLLHVLEEYATATDAASLVAHAA